MHSPSPDQENSLPLRPDASLDEIDSFFYRPPAEFFIAHRHTALTYDDVSLATRYSSVLPRQTSVATRLSEELALNIPILSSDMDTVTEAGMAKAMALNGGLGLIHYNMSLERQVREVAEVKHHIHGLNRSPVTVRPGQRIGEVLDLMEERGYSFSTFPVTDDEGVLVGLLPGKVVRPRYATLFVHAAMTPMQGVRAIDESELGNDPIARANRFFDDHVGIHKLLVVDRAGRLRGLFTLTDIERIQSEARLDRRRACRDSAFRLVVGAALPILRTRTGEVDRDRTLAHVTNLVAEGVDAVAVSSAHAHTESMGQTIRLVRDAFPGLTLIAGNVTSAAGVGHLADCGADAIKIGQGPGSICTTRVVAGVGVPQLTALHVTSLAASRKGVRIIADGGITKSGDIVKALTLADAVILGGLLAGCREAPGEIVEINGKLYKQYRGMGSEAAMRQGSAARYGQDSGSSHREAKDSARTRKLTAEGIEALKEVAGSVDTVLDSLVGGIQSGLGYLGAATLPQLRAQARFVRVSPAGLHESKPHDVIEIAKKVT